MLITNVFTRSYAQNVSFFSIRIKVYVQKPMSRFRSIRYILSYRSKTKCYYLRRALKKFGSKYRKITTT